MKVDSPVGMIVLTALVIFLIFSTGGLNSPFFPLLYFLAFAIGFLLKPVLVFVITTAISLAFLPDSFKGDLVANMVKTGLFTFVAPLAFFMAKIYKKEEKEDAQIEAIQERAQDSADTIAKDVGEIMKTEKELDPNSTKRLNEILEETEDLREESK